MTKDRYLNYNKVLKSIFPERVQKISVNAGFTCPNRDGSKAIGGCTYCNNLSFSPDYCKPTKSIKQQLEEGIQFFYHKYQGQSYLAYFQSYTNTYDSIDKLKVLYEEALSLPQVKGLVIGTRPDCVSDELLDYFASLQKSHYVMIEYGVESTLDETLIMINRGHDFACAEEAILNTAKRGIPVGVHLILGLPKETREQILSHADVLSSLPITTLKLHQLQLIRGTKMAKQYVENPEWFTFYSAQEYVDLSIDFLERLNPSIAIERFISQSPKHLLLNKGWDLKNFEFLDMIEKRIIERNTKQGVKWKNNLSIN